MTDNRQIVERIFAATADGDGRLFVEAMSDDCVWRARGAGSWSGNYRGKEAILGKLLGPLGRRIEGGRTRTIATRILDAGDVVVVEAEGRNRTVDGADYCNQYCFVISLRGGKMVEIVEYLDTELVERVLGPRPSV